MNRSALIVAVALTFVASEHRLVAQTTASQRPGSPVLIFEQSRASAAGTGEGNLAELCRGTVKLKSGQRLLIEGKTVASGRNSHYTSEPSLIVLNIDGVEPPDTRNNLGSTSPAPHSLAFTFLTTPLSAGPHEIRILGWYASNYSFTNCRAWTLN